MDSDTKTDDEEKRVYTVDSHSAAATATMPSKPFEERQEDNTNHRVRP